MDTLSLFLDNPQSRFHVREVARLVKESPTTVSTKLRRFKKEGFLLSKKEKNHLLYWAGASSVFKEMKQFHNLKKIRNSGLLLFLTDFYNYPSAIVLFGSFRKGEDTSASDIDICIVTSKEGEPNLTKFERKLKHNIHLFVLSKEKLGIIKQKNPELLNNIINGLVVEGFLEVF